MEISQRRVDRRIQRTRQALAQAFLEIVREKGFTATNVQDIIQRANLNRGTFYIHFEDKYELLGTIIRERFQQQLCNMLPAAPRWDRKTLQLLIQTVLTRLEAKYQHQPAASPFLAGLFARRIHQELTECILTRLKPQAWGETLTEIPLETVARVISWGIFGAAVQWSQESSSLSSEEMGQYILEVVMEGARHLVPALSRQEKSDMNQSRRLCH
jgi:AcrR family transcriptional regulator